jgi:hypothetical protein
VIHGCYLDRIGTLRVIDPSTGERCALFETSIGWSQTGPQGPAGPQGAAGPQGPAGPSPFAGYVDGGNQQPVNCPANYQPVSWNLSPTPGIADPPLVRSSQFNIGSPTGVIIDVFGDPGTYNFQLLCQLGGTPDYVSGSYVIP